MFAGKINRKRITIKYQRYRSITIIIIILIPTNSQEGEGNEKVLKTPSLKRKGAKWMNGEGEGGVRGRVNRWRAHGVQ